MNKILRFAACALTLSLVGCGADVEGACQAYIDAANGCVAEAYPDDAATYEVADTYCDAYAGMKDKESADLLNCYADAYDAADCSTTEGYTGATADMSACAGA